MTTPNTETQNLLRRARSAVRRLTALPDDAIDAALRNVADAIQAATPAILEANRIDLERMSPDDYRYDRLQLTSQRIADIADDMRNVSTLPSPRKVLESRILPNGLKLRKVAVPFGVLGVVYEARPNVSADVFALGFKSANVCVLKGGHDAINTNRAIVDVIRDELMRQEICPDVITLLPSTHQATQDMLTARGLVDLVIPRGSRRLIDMVRQQATVPVIETGAGVCHCYVHKDADIDMARAIVTNAKTRRVSVCNALDCIVIDSDISPSLPSICADMASRHVRIYADEQALAALAGRYPADLLHAATPESYGTEFLDYALAIRTVDGIEAALEHIDINGSGHSESIVTDNSDAAAIFCNNVDAACVYVNAPTSFTDGAQFGLGAEIGISTQKLHARGPMALNEIMTYKWIVEGTGQIRK